MKPETIYLKIPEKVFLSQPRVKLGDLGSFYCTNHTLLKAIKELPFCESPKEKEDLACSLMKVMECVGKEYPGVSVVNLGETQFLLHYEGQERKKKGREVLKLLLVLLICFWGAFFTMMTFNEDVSVPAVILTLYSFLGQTEPPAFPWIEVFYSLGIFLGILLFFYHGTRKEKSRDPTPVQVEMTVYEKDTNQAILQQQSLEGKELDVGK